MNRCRHGPFVAPRGGHGRHACAWRAIGSLRLSCVLWSRSVGHNRMDAVNTRPHSTSTLLAVPAALTAATLIGTCMPSLAAPPGAAAEEWAPRRLLVVPRAGLGEGELGKIIGVHGGKSRRMGGSNIHVIDLPQGASETAVRTLLARHPHLKNVELDRRVPAAFVANDPYLGSAWHLGKIGAQTAWDTTQGSGVTIAILDSGVLPTHPDLASRLVPGWNFIDNNANTADVHGHGTAVAGAAAAATNNGVGVSSVAGAAQIMPIRIADANAYAYWSTVAQGLTWAADRGARVANISYLGVAGSAAVQNAAQYMRSKGGLVVVCAGNTGIDEGIAPTTTMIPVSATDANDQKTSWSSWGNFVAVSAPGINIWTTAKSGGYEQWWGTSMASPVTAGVVALMMAANKALPPAQIESLLYSTAVDLGAPGRDAVFGHGRVNASAAVAAAANAAAVDAQAPLAAITTPGGGTTVSGVATVDVAASDNVGVARVELRINGSTVATDIAAPFQFSWNTAGYANGSATLVAVAFDAAGNSASSQAVSVNIANGGAAAADTTAPKVTIVSPTAGAVAGTVQISVAASDDSGSAGITHTLFIDGQRVATGSGASLSYNWNSRKASVGNHLLMAVARDAAGNQSSTSVTVRK